MVFASGIFLFLFLPVTLSGTLFLKNKPVIYRNIFLLIMSLGFYLESGVKTTLLLILSVFINYLMARIIVAVKTFKVKKIVLIIDVFYNIGMLFVFKYFAFVLEQLKQVVPGISIVVSIALPLGISFYTFQALSYVIDVYRDASKIEKNIINVALYISLFPQLVAGPIVRWETVREKLRQPLAGDWNEGLARFSIGLGKKVIIANQMAIFADKAFKLLEESELTTGFGWMGAVAYTMQIYFDFSGYSDMAIGLGKILGFDFPENFNYPYISSSITEFWRRWHISLSSWFRDYVYIPLGGNRCSKGRMFFNLFVVWMLTGIWHGANYTFWIWGLCYFIFLAMEKLLKPKLKKTKVFTGIGYVYTILIVVLLWVMFKSASVSEALKYYLCMFTNSAESAYAFGVTKLYFRNFLGILLLAIIGCTPAIQKTGMILTKRGRIGDIIKQLFIVVVFLLSVCITIDSDYNPFIYFNF